MYKNKEISIDVLREAVRIAKETKKYSDCSKGIRQDVLYGYGRLYSLAYNYYKEQDKEKAKKMKDKYLVNCLKPLSPELFNFAKEVDVMTPLEIETKRKIKRREEYEKRKIRRRIT